MQQTERLADKWLGSEMVPFHKHLEFAIVDAPLDRTLAYFAGWIALQWGDVSLLEGDPECAAYPLTDVDPVRPTRHVSRHRTWGAVLSTPSGRPDVTLVETKLFEFFDAFRVALPDVRTVRLYSHFNIHNSRTKDYQHGMIACCGGQRRVVDHHYGAGPPGDRWRFHEEGPVQAFETPESYRAERKMDRVTRRDVIAWAKALGVDVYGHVLAGHFDRTIRIHPSPTPGYRVSPAAPFEEERELLVNAGVNNIDREGLAVDKQF